MLTRLVIVVFVALETGFAKRHIMRIVPVDGAAG
jgi:hypothetical protein